MNKLLPKVVFTSSIIYVLVVQCPSPAFSESTTSSHSTPTHQSSKKTTKKSSKKYSSKKNRSKAGKHSKKTAASQVAPRPETAIPSQPEERSGPALSQIVTAYKYAYELYTARQFAKAKDIFRKITLVTDQPALKSNSLYYFSQCAFRTEDYLGCVKALKLLAQKEPNCAAIQKGYVSRFCAYIIAQVADLQTNWDYFRYQIRSDDNGNPAWRESIPPGPKIKRINFRLGFGLYRVLHMIQPNTPADAQAKQRLENMLNAPLTILWVDEKAPETKYGHPEDFFSILSTREKKHFSNVICERMFYDFQTEYFYKFLDMHDDVRNLKPRFVAVTKKTTDNGLANPPEVSSLPPPSLNGAAPVTTALSTEENPNVVLTLDNLLHVAGYFPWMDSYSNTIESEPIDLNL